jgi:hypothetical protein
MDRSNDVSTDDTEFTSTPYHEFHWPPNKALTINTTRLPFTKWDQHTDVFVEGKLIKRLGNQDGMGIPARPNGFKVKFYITWSGDGKSGESTYRATLLGNGAMCLDVRDGWGDGRVDYQIRYFHHPKRSLAQSLGENFKRFFAR